MRATKGALHLSEGNETGRVGPEELEAARFFALANTLGLNLNLTIANTDLVIA